MNKIKLILLSSSILNYVKKVAAEIPLLSGPVSLDLYTTDIGNTYIYLSDRHFSRSGMCKSEIGDIDVPQFSVYNFLIDLGEILRKYEPDESVNFFSEHSMDNRLRKYDMEEYPLSFVRKIADKCYDKKDTRLDICGNVNFYAIDPRTNKEQSEFDSIINMEYYDIDDYLIKYNNFFYGENVFENMPDDSYIKKYIEKLPEKYKNIFTYIAKEYYEYVKEKYKDDIESSSSQRVIILTSCQVELIALAESLIKNSPISVFYFGKFHSKNAEYLITTILPKYLDINFEKQITIDPEIFKYGKENYINFFGKERCLDIKTAYEFLPKPEVKIPRPFITGDLSGLPSEFKEF